VFYPHGLHKVDKQGRPIYIELIGEVKIDEVFKNTTPERLLSYQARQYEYLLNSILPICSQSAKKHVSQTFTILDLKKASTKLLSKKFYNFVKLTSQNSQNYYPEILGQMFVVNSGLMVKAAWSVVKAFIDDKTKKKIITCGSDYKKKLLEHVDAANLPKSLGGECDCGGAGCIYSNSGPWNVDGKTEVVIDEDLLKIKDNIILETGDNEEELDNNELNNDDENDEDREKLEELSKELKGKMSFSKEKNAGIEAKLQHQDGEFGDTPINTQEVNIYLN
jgi:hypothetical protein